MKYIEIYIIYIYIYDWCLLFSSAHGAGEQTLEWAGDNWDHNEHTVEGRTTHAMTSILTVWGPPGEEQTAGSRIPRSQSCTYDTHLPGKPMLKGHSRAIFPTIYTLYLFMLWMVSGGNLSSVIHYTKPSKRPEPLIVPPPTLADIEPDKTAGARRFQYAELVYHVGRSVGSEQEPLLPWTPFHFQVKLCKGDVPVSTIAFNPILMALPTDHSTIYTTLLRKKKSWTAWAKRTSPSPSTWACWQRPLKSAGQDHRSCQGSSRVKMGCTSWYPCWPASATCTVVLG